MTTTRLEKVLVGPTATVREALQRIDTAALRTVVVADERGVLLGVLSDGDVRRWILAGNSLTVPVTAAMSSNPHVLPVDWTHETAEQIMVSRRIDFLPVVDGEGVVRGAVHWTDLFEAPHVERERVDLPVVIMAGGEGSRLGPYTKILPKPLVPVGEVPVIELIMERFAQFACTRFHVSVNYKANLIRAYFADRGLPYSIDFAQEESPLGTGGSLSLLRDRIDTTFFLTNCDILVDADYADVLAYHRTSGNVITLVASMKHVTVPYGVCEITEGGALTSINEKPQFDFLVSTGFYVIEPEVLADVPEDTFIHLTDIIDRYLEAGTPVGVYPVSEKSWLDVGQLEELQATLEHFGVA